MVQSEEHNDNSFLAGQLLTSLSATNELIQNLSKEIQSHAINLATIKAGLGNLDDTVSSLSKILKEGSDGQGSVLARIAVLDTVVESLDESVETMQTEITTMTGHITKVKSRIHVLEQEFHSKAQIEKEKKDEELEQNRNNMQFKLTLFASIAAFITSIITALLAFLLSS